ncbi:nuclease PIN [Sinomonas sp. G460-2]|uniref:nuclease PIN n=1 Tax=Sinomonas sp. G460-2 TaxID=3393464 RepID=UPI0039EFAB3D
MKLRLFPQETAALELLADIAQQSVLAGQVLSEMFGARRQDHERIFEELMKIDARTSELQRALLTQLRTSFVNPLPREDLLGLSEGLGQAMDQLVAVGEITVVNRLDRLAREASDQLEIVNRQAELTVTAMRGLGRLDDLEDYWVEMLRLAKRADHTHRVWSAKAMRELSLGAYARGIEMARALQGAAQALRGVAASVGRIIVKES